MPDGIRATVTFSTSEVCRVTRLSETAGTVIDSMSASVSLPGPRGSATEFLVDADHVPDDGDCEPIFSYGTKHLCRASHDGEVTCPCECLGLFGCPVDRYVARDGELTLVFHAADFQQLQDVIAELRDRFPGVDIKRLVGSPTQGTPRDAVFVDRSKLTDRQYEVLQTAYEMGYYERPRRSNATEIAAELGIDPSTLTEHLAAAQTKLLGDFLEDSG